MSSAVLGGPIPNPKPTKEQQDTAAAVMAELRAAQKALGKNDTEANRRAVAKATAKYRALPDLFFSDVPRTGRGRKTRGRHSTRRGGMGEATLRRVKDLFGFTKPVPQENPQDVARRRWCDANFGRIPARQLQCYQEAPDDVSSSNPWPKRPDTVAGRRRSTRRGARASRKRPTR